MTEKKKKNSQGLESVVSTLSGKSYQYWQGSFNEYLSEVLKDPHKHLRMAPAYLSDAIDHFGYEWDEEFGKKVKRYKIFDDVFASPPDSKEQLGPHRVIGNLETKASLVKSIKSMSSSEKGRIIILDGPVGNGKTSLIKLLMRGLEYYSLEDEGAVYSISWIFNKNSTKKPSIGFGNEEKQNGNNYNVNELDPQATLLFKCRMNDHPLLMLPKHLRPQVLTKLMGKYDSIPPRLLQGDACQDCSAIREELHNKYQGDWDKILKHLLVRRLRMDELNKVGLATVEPVQNPEGLPAHFQAMTVETDVYANLKWEFPGIQLSHMEGKWVHANRGIIHYSDAFIRDAPYLQHLLSAVEGYVDLNGSTAFSDTVIFATTNKEQFQQFKQNSHHKAFLDRSNAIQVKYLMNYNEETEMYKKMLRENGYSLVKKENHYHPLLPSVAAMWSVMTRLEIPHFQVYDLEEFSLPRLDDFLEKHPEFEKLVKKVNKKDMTISPLVKAKIYAGEFDQDVHDACKSDDLFSLLKKKEFVRYLRKEDSKEGLYGISPRVMENLFSSLAKTHEFDDEKSCIDVVSLLNWWDKLETDKEVEEYPFLKDLIPDYLHIKNNAGDVVAYRRMYGGGYAHIEGVGNFIKPHFEERMRMYAVSSLLGIDEREIEKMFTNYVIHLSGNKRKMKSVVDVDGRRVDVSPAIIDQFEMYMGLSDDGKRRFRNDMFTKIIGSSEASQKKFAHHNLTELFSEEIDRAKHTIYDERIKDLDLTQEELLIGMSAYGQQENFAKLPEDRQEYLTTVLDRMKRRHGFCDMCAVSTMNYVCTNDLVDIKKS